MHAEAIKNNISENDIKNGNIQLYKPKSKNKWIKKKWIYNLRINVLYNK